MEKHVYKIGNSVETIEFCPPNICPICKAGIGNDASFKDVAIDKYSNLKQFCTVTRCFACNSFFLTIYDRSPKDRVFYPKASHPRKPKATTFSDCISETFPMFVNLYNQSEIAESMGLSDICGVGYRKSLEFLVKDYLINLADKDTSIDKEKIKTAPLSQCINKIKDERIKNVATKSAWLGNDETHYKRKYQDRDIHDMKKFILATVKLIDLEYTIEEQL